MAASVAETGRGALTPHEERVEWAKSLRLLVSPPEILEADGTIHQEWFRPKLIGKASSEPAKKWGEEQKDLLVEVCPYLPEILTGPFNEQLRRMPRDRAGHTQARLRKLEGDHRGVPSRLGRPRPQAEDCATSWVPGPS